MESKAVFGNSDQINCGDSFYSEKLELEAEVIGIKHILNLPHFTLKITRGSRVSYEKTLSKSGMALMGLKKKKEIVELFA